MLADISGQQLDYRTGGDVGPALGAARLAQIAANPEKSLIELLPQLPLDSRIYQMRSVMPLISHDEKRSVASISNFCH